MAIVVHSVGLILKVNRFFSKIFSFSNTQYSVIRFSCLFKFLHVYRCVCDIIRPYHILQHLQYRRHGKTLVSLADLKTEDSKLAFFHKSCFFIKKTV